MIQKLGPLKDVFAKMPGIGGLADQGADGELKTVEAQSQSMTKAEKAEPSIIDTSRAGRIARGCGRSVKDIEGLVERFSQMRQMMGMLGKQGGLLGGLGGGGGMPGMGGVPGMPSGMSGMGGGFDPMAMLGSGGRGATKKRQDPKAKKNKRKQQRASRKKKRKKKSAPTRATVSAGGVRGNRAGLRHLNGSRGPLRLTRGRRPATTIESPDDGHTTPPTRGRVTPM